MQLNIFKVVIINILNLPATIIYSSILNYTIKYINLYHSILDSDVLVKIIVQIDRINTKDGFW